LYPTHTIIYKVPQSSSEFQTQIQLQRQGRFPNASSRRAPIGRWENKNNSDIDYPFEDGEVINYTLDCVSILPVTTKVQASFLTQLPLRDFTMRPMVTLKQLQSLVAVIREK
jgi:hypothetical protein